MVGPRKLCPHIAVNQYDTMIYTYRLISGTSKTHMPTRQRWPIACCGPNLNTQAKTQVNKRLEACHARTSTRYATTIHSLLNIQFIIRFTFPAASSVPRLSEPPRSTAPWVPQLHLVSCQDCSCHTPHTLEGQQSTIRRHRQSYA